MYFVFELTSAITVLTGLDILQLPVLIDYIHFQIYVTFYNHVHLLCIDMCVNYETIFTSWN
jgi:hypothetical protein